MADLKARLIRGDRFSAEDTLEIQLTYTGEAHSCDQYIELVSGVAVTHGGGASATTPLHYKAIERDADGDGNIDYSSSEMAVVQAEKGTSVIKVCAEVVLKSEEDAWQAEYDAWEKENMVTITLDDGTETIVYKNVAADSEEEAGTPNAPTPPTPTVYKSGEITLEWSDDSFV
jgi:hypothetical protein